jgi:hypothetical protein
MADALHHHAVRMGAAEEVLAALEEDLARPVPATPDWTARHVSERSSRSTAELVDELRSDVPGIQASVEDNPRPALTGEQLDELPLFGPRDDDQPVPE